MVSKGLKRPKRYEGNYLPDIPEGQREDSLETERKLLVEEMKKWNPSGAVIASKMDQIFPLRRREIVEASKENFEGAVASSFYGETSKH